MHESQNLEAPLLVFCDEAHLHLDIDLGWGRARRGQRLYVHSDSPSLSRKRIWDNVRYHHAVAVRDCAQQLGIEPVNLPAYSPDLMPVIASVFPRAHLPRHQSQILIT